MVPEWSVPWLLAGGCAAGAALFLLCNPLRGALKKGTGLFVRGIAFVALLWAAGAWEEWERRRPSAWPVAEHQAAGGGIVGWPDLGPAARPQWKESVEGLRSVFWMAAPWRAALFAGPFLAMGVLWIRRDLCLAGGESLRAAVAVFVLWVLVSAVIWAETLARWRGWTVSWWGSPDISRLLALAAGGGYAVWVQGGLFLAVGRRALGRTEGWDLRGLLAMMILSARRMLPIGILVALGMWVGELAAGKGWAEPAVLGWGAVLMAAFAAAPVTAAMRGGSWLTLLRQGFARVLLYPRQHFWWVALTLTAFYFLGVTDRWVCAAWEPGSPVLYAWYAAWFTARIACTLWLIVVFATYYAESLAETGKPRPRTRRAAAVPA